MKIVLLYYDEDIATGGFYDNFEYYYILRKHFGNGVILKYITSHTKEDCMIQLNDKYVNIEKDIWDGIEFLPHKRGKLFSTEKVDIVFSAISATLIWFVHHKNILVANTYMGLCDIPELVEPSPYYKHLKLLYDERVFSREGRYMPYRKKILFDKYRTKHFGEGKHEFLINLSLTERRYQREWLESVIDTLKKDGDVATYIDNKNTEYYKWLEDKVTIYKPPIKDFMGLFNTFVYIPYTDGHDSTPRLIPECKFYGKGVMMHTDDFRKSGGFYRYNDTVDNFESLWLKKNDELISIIERLDLSQ